MTHKEKMADRAEARKQRRAERKADREQSLAEIVESRKAEMAMYRKNIGKFFCGTCLKEPSVAYGDGIGYICAACLNERMNK